MFSQWISTKGEMWTYTHRKGSDIQTISLRCNMHNISIDRHRADGAHRHLRHPTRTWSRTILTYITLMAVEGRTQKNVRSLNGGYMACTHRASCAYECVCSREHYTMRCNDKIFRIYMHNDANKLIKYIRCACGQTICRGECVVDGRFREWSV